MPFTDPMADGPAIQRAGQRALDGGQTMDRTLAMVRAFRAADPATPVVLMGYYNPIYSRGVGRFLAEAKRGRRRRPDHRRPAARGGRGALPAGTGGGAELHPPRHANHRRPPAAPGADQHLGLCLLRRDHRHHRRRRGQRRRGRPGGRPDQGRDAAAGLRRLRHPHPRGRRRDRRRRRRRGGRLGDRRADRRGRFPAAVLDFVRSLAKAAHGQ